MSQLAQKYVGADKLPVKKVGVRTRAIVVGNRHHTHVAYELVTLDTQRNYLTVER